MQDLKKAGKSNKEIAYALGRTEASVRMKLHYIEITSALKKQEPREPAVIKPREMSPREMIKALYDLGYRIENNQLVCYVKQRVNLSDIISEQK